LWSLVEVVVEMVMVEVEEVLVVSELVLDYL
jgi:hypothetical protein